MAKATLKLDLNNKYKSEFWVGSRLVAHGNNGLESVELKSMGKRTAAVLTLTGLNVIVGNSECPETHRYREIEERFGDVKRLSELGLVCDLLQVSPTACDGCPVHPRTSV